MAKIKLTDDQQKIFDNVVNSVHNNPGRFEAVIVGYAGTGKSTLVSEIIKNLCYGYNIAVTSPTHKANQVLKGMLNAAGVSVTKGEDAEVMTIHSFLGLKLVYEKSKQVLKHDPKSKNSNMMTDVLFIDECSMVSEELFHHLMTQIHRVRRAVIFVGDSCQLPPVEENSTGSRLSPSFNYGTKFELTHVLRQALDNPIIKLATQVRECIGTNDDPLRYVYNSSSDNILSTGVEEDFLETYFQYVNGTSAALLFNKVQDNKIIAYTNYRVDMANITIRSRIFPDFEEELIAGEPIVFESITENCPYMVQEMISCPALTKDSFMGIDCWKMNVGSGRSILVVGPVGKLDLNDKLQELVNKINAKERNPFTKQPYMWQDYYLIKEKINVVNYPYATTAHKSQGSTFDNIWFDTDFISRISNNDDKSRILYTALTRPRYRIILK